MKFSRTRSSRIEAAEWVAAFREGPGTEQERRRFVEWLQESPRHVAEYLEIAGLWHDIGDVARSIDVRALLDGADTDGTVTRLRPEDASALTERQAPPLATDARHDGGARRPASGPRPTESSRPAVDEPRRRLLLGVVATGLIAVAVGWWLAPRGREPVEYGTDVGEQRSLPLEDGSIVSLNTQSRIRVALGDSARRVELLAGEALFDVAPDPDRPFIVSAGGTEIRAVGTSFNVYRRAGGVAVTVLEGRVALRSIAPQSTAASRATDRPAAGSDYGNGSALGATDFRSAQRRVAAARDSVAERVVELGIGEQAYVEPASTEITAAPANVERVMAWTERRLIFENDTLADVIAEFNRYNVDKLEVLDRGLAELRLSGVFEAHDPESMIEFLRRTGSVRVVQVGDSRRVLVP